MCKYIHKLILLLVWVVTPFLLLSCASESAYQSQTTKEYTRLVQTVSIIKYKISQDTLYQKEPYRSYADQYMVYLDSLLKRVNNRALTAKDALNIVNETYVQFKAGKFHSKNMLYEENEPPKKRNIPDKPGAL